MAHALKLGIPATIISDWPTQTFAALFEDDGDTGYFYAMEVDQRQTVDAVQIYYVEAVVDRGCHESEPAAGADKGDEKLPPALSGLAGYFPIPDRSQEQDREEVEDHPAYTASPLRYLAFATSRTRARK